MRSKVPQYTYNKKEYIASTCVVEAHLKLHGFHVDAIHPKLPWTARKPMTGLCSPLQVIIYINFGQYYI